MILHRPSSQLGFATVQVFFKLSCNCFICRILALIAVILIRPDDEIIPYALYPEISGSENLTEFSLQGIMATGSHAEAAL